MVYGRKRYRGRRRRYGRGRRRYTKARRAPPRRRYYGRRRMRVGKKRSWNKAKIAGLFPRELVTTMHFHQHILMSNGNGHPSTYSILPTLRCNSIYDPGLTMVTDPCQFRSLYATYYDYYEVLSSKLTMTFSPFTISDTDPTLNELGPTMFVNKYDQDGVALDPSSGLNAGWMSMIGDPTVRMIEMNLNRPGQGGFPKGGKYVFKRRWTKSDLHKIAGPGGALPANYAALNANPTAEAYWTSAIWPKATLGVPLTEGLVQPYQVTIRIDYKTRFFGLKDLVVSS